jgi:hypothetical protein
MANFGHGFGKNALPILALQNALPKFTKQYGRKASQGTRSPKTKIS